MAFAPVKLALKRVLLDAWIYRWQKTARGHSRKDCRQTRYWLIAPNPALTKAIMELERWEIALIVQFITGFNNLNYHSHNKNLEITWRCRLCGDAKEEAIHFVGACPRTLKLATGTFGPFGLNEDWTPADLISFVLHPTITACLTERTELE